MDISWASDPRKRADFAYRGVHLTALAANALIRAFYRQDARYRYFSGCSDGGREALPEARRFPDNFDGIVAGAPAMALTVQNSLFHGWQARANTDAGGKLILLAGACRSSTLPYLRPCDAGDGLTYGLVDTIDVTVRSGEHLPVGSIDRHMPYA